MTITPEVLEAELPLVTAATRLDFLSRRDGLAGPLNFVVDDDDDDESWSAFRTPGTSLDVDEALELLALGEVVARKAHDSRHLAIRAARRGGALWSEIGAALNTTAIKAWNGHHRWIEEQVELFERTGEDGLDDVGAVQALALAGPRPVVARATEAQPVDA